MDSELINALFIFWKLSPFNLRLIQIKHNMETFQQIINGDKPVLIDFYATWCGPCKAMSPIVEQIGKEMQGQARVLKIDISNFSKMLLAKMLRLVAIYYLLKCFHIVFYLY